MTLTATLEEIIHIDLVYSACDIVAGEKAVTGNAALLWKITFTKIPSWSGEG